MSQRQGDLYSDIVSLGFRAFFCPVETRVNQAVQDNFFGVDVWLTSIRNSLHLVGRSNKAEPHLAHLNIVDEYTREALMIRVERKLNSTNQLDALNDQFILHGPAE